MKLTTLIVQLIKQEEIMLFLNYPDKFIIGINKNKKLIIKNYSLVDNDDDIVHMYNRRELDKELESNSEDEKLYNEFEEI